MYRKNRNYHRTEKFISKIANITKHIVGKRPECYLNINVDSNNQGNISSVSIFPYADECNKCFTISFAYDIGAPYVVGDRKKRRHLDAYRATHIGLAQIKRAMKA